MNTAVRPPKLLKITWQRVHVKAGFTAGQDTGAKIAEAVVFASTTINAFALPIHDVDIVAGDEHELPQCALPTIMKFSFAWFPTTCSNTTCFLQSHDSRFREIFINIS